MFYHTLHLKCVKLSKSFSQEFSVARSVGVSWHGLSIHLVSSVITAARLLCAAVFICSTNPVRVSLHGQKQDIDWSFIAHITDSISFCQSRQFPPTPRSAPLDLRLAVTGCMPESGLSWIRYSLQGSCSKSHWLEGCSLISQETTVHF